MLDEPLSITSRNRAHYESCLKCQQRAAKIGGTRALVAGEMAASVNHVDLGAARGRLQASLQNTGRSRRLGPTFGWRFRSYGRSWAWAACVGVLLLGALVFSPGSSFARSFLTVFQPKQFTPISITQGELRTLPNLARYGTLSGADSLNGRQYSSLSAAESAAGMHVVAPSFVPASVPRVKTFQVIPPHSSSFTFSAEKASRVAARYHQQLKPMPKSLNGASIHLFTGSAVMTIYGHQRGIPSLIVGQTDLPRITATGASLRTFERYILHLPGVSKNLAKQIMSIGNPTTTLPIPIPVSWAFAQHVNVQGSPGLLVGDDTGVASVLIWQRHGVVHGVAGSLTRSQIVQVADSLH